MVTETVKAAVYERLTGEDEGRVCKDIPDQACDEQPSNFLKHVISLALTKTGDSLADPKLVLAWLLTSLGTPAFLIGLLVPVREAGALLPQMFIAASVRVLPVRKWVWVAGSLIQGLAVIAMALAALSLDGAAAGWTIVILLAIFALARSACSISHKDVLGKTVSKSTRGTATGTASSISAFAALMFGVLLTIGILEKSTASIAGVVFVAGALWLAAAVVFANLAEVPGATEGGGNPIAVVIDQFGLLREDDQLVRFIAARGLLISTALAPPYILAVAGGEAAGNGLGQLGPYVLASSLAAMGSGVIWGRLSDRSSRQVLIRASLIAAGALGAGAVIAALGTDLVPPLTLAVVLFVLMVAYQGVRLGRATHIVDMTDADKRAAYTALSNTIVGGLLLLGGVFGLVAQFAGLTVLLAVFALMCIAAAFIAGGLDDVQE